MIEDVSLVSKFARFRGDSQGMIYAIEMIFEVHRMEAKINIVLRKCIYFVERAMLGQTK